MTGSTSHPIPPAVHRDDGVDDLEEGIRVEFGMPEKQEEEDVVGNADEPVPCALTDRKRHRCSARNEAQDFNPSHENEASW